MSKVRVVQEGDNVVVYIHQVIGNATKLSRSEDGPIWALDVAHTTLAYKRRGRANTATRTDSYSDGYRKRDSSDSDGDGDDRGRPSKGNTSKSMSQMRQERASEHSLSASLTTSRQPLGAAHSAQCTRLPVSIFKSTMPVSVVRQPVSVLKSCMPMSILKSSSPYSVSGSRSCSLGISSSKDTDASGGRWFLDCPTVKVPVTLHRTTDCIRGQERKCRGDEKCQSEV